MIRQRWQRLALLHWSVDPMLLAPLLPHGLDLDTWQGRAYLGIVPFTIRQSRPSFLPAVLGLSNFHELNLRTYVHRRGHDPGVWFFSLDAASRLAVWGARIAYKLPYYPADITLREGQDGWISFASRRVGAGPPASFSCGYRPISAPFEAEPGTLEFFLAERYLLYSWDGRWLRSARVWHEPYPLAVARAREMSEALTAAAHIDLPRTPEVATHYAHDLDVWIYGPALVGAVERPLVPAAAVLADQT